jgi:hypothetical protein
MSRPPCWSSSSIHRGTSSSMAWVRVNRKRWVFRPASGSSGPLPRERFWDVQVVKIDSPTRQPMCPGRSAVAALHCAEHHCTHNDWTACRMRLHVACTGCGTYGPFATFGHTPAPYACRGLSASGFALPWRTARSWARRLHEAGSRNK